MEKKFFSCVFLFLLGTILILPLREKCFGTSGIFIEKTKNFAPQTEKKPKYDYMDKILLNTKPLGLKDNPVLRRYLNQPAIKWAIRSEKRHILN